MQASSSTAKSQAQRSQSPSPAVVPSIPSRRWNQDFASSLNFSPASPISTLHCLYLIFQGVVICSLYPIGISKAETHGVPRMLACTLSSGNSASPITNVPHNKQPRADDLFLEGFRPGCSRSRTSRPMNTLGIYNAKLAIPTPQSPYEGGTVQDALGWAMHLLVVLRST